MTPYIKQEVASALDADIKQLLNTLRELESDGDELSYSTDDSVCYIIDKLLSIMYTHNSAAMLSGIGMLEVMKDHFLKQHVHPIIKQSEYDNSIPTD